VVITEILDPEALKAGVKVGDVVKKVDGETLVDRFKRQAPYVSASTPQRLTADVARRILNGPEGSNALLTLEDHAGNRKEATLKRSKDFAAALETESSSEPVKVLRGGIGYADLRSLKRQDVDAMFEKFRGAPAIVFDMRGLPADDSIAAIAPRLTAEADVPGAIVTGPIVSAPDLPQGSIASPSSSYFFLQTIGSSSEWRYAGKTAMLVDERTVGAGEQAALFLEAANKTEFIGTPSAGANSILTNFSVPGGIVISLSGEDIRHANGGKLQRMGLQPNVTVAPTITGIRTAKDEVLEKALDYLSPKAPAAKTASLNGAGNVSDLIRR
jgi:C-terminal processing protease CtpA/Prc